jgi:hypothetical protein
MALAAGVQWDVRTTGSDTNGGGFDHTVVSPGTDYSQHPPDGGRRSHRGPVFPNRY